MTTRRLLFVQTHDPGRGSFMVNPMPVKSRDGKRKQVDGLPVYRAAHHVEHTGSGPRAEAHPEAFDFIVLR